MGKIAILPRRQTEDEPDRQRLTERSMPLAYMGDFSIPGILVDGDRLPEALQLLAAHRFEVITRNRCAEIVTRDLSHMRELFGVLEKGGIAYGFADLADRLYQG